MDDVKVTPNPAATSPSPVAPAPAPEPTPQPAPETPAAPVQRTLADAQIAMAEIPATVPPVATPESPAVPTQTPEEIAKAEQRVKDAQRKMHESTAEASRLRSELNGILNHPMLGPVVRNVMTPPGTPAAPADQELADAYKQWQSAPNDQEAFGVLLATAERRAKASVMSELNEREIQRVNQARAKQKDAMVAQAINREVAEKANDVPIELFWAMSTRAEMETPVTLLTLPEKLEWQINRSIELARSVIDGKAKQAVEAQAQASAVRQTASPVMAPGSTNRAGTPGTRPTKSFVDQLRETQARKITS